MENVSESKAYYLIQSDQLPLGVYREVAAHLRQIPGVETGLISRSSCPENAFDYLQSQVESLWIRYAEAQAPAIQPQIDQILGYYGDRMVVGK
ncbi:MAG: hypothetical protein HC835_12190 [Oscillatoriales cyanobacterium RM2_1_1]|nr:hypothetical protein [Oscillatoriales cyanobacterium RM2_1_1]